MNYQEWIKLLKPPTIELINEFIREEDGMSIFYKEQLRRDKRPYWKGMILNSKKRRNKLIKYGESIFGNKFKLEEMGLTETEIKSAIEENKKFLK